MAKLSSAIVQRKLATLRDVEEALARQVLYGGDLATNLLEQAPHMDERALTLLLAETQQLPPAPAGQLPQGSSDALALVPGDVALRHGVYPLEKTGSSLVVAVSEPMKPDVEQDLAFGLGVNIVQRVAPLVRVKQAICRDYGLPLDRRSHRVLAKLEGKPDPSPSLTPAPLVGAPDFASLPRPPSIPPLGLPTDLGSFGTLNKSAIPALRPLPQVTINEPEADTPAPSRSGASIYDRLTSPAPPEASGGGTAPTPTLRAEPGALQLPPVWIQPQAPPPASSGERRPSYSSRPPPPAVGAEPRRASVSGQKSVHRTDLGAWSVENKHAERRPRGRHRGPYTAAAAEEDLLNADSRDAVLTALFDYACQYFEYSALFAVHGDLAEGRSANGPGADHEKITGIGVALDMPGALATARKEGHFSIQALAKDGLDAQLARDLERKRGKKVLLLPILVRGRCVLIFYGDDGDEDVDLSRIGDVLAFAPLVASALEGVIRKKKASLRQGAAMPREASIGPVPRSRAVIPTREERREALAAALESTLRRASSRPPPARTSRPPPVPARGRSTPPAAPESMRQSQSAREAAIEADDAAVETPRRPESVRERRPEDDQDRPITEPAIPAARAAASAPPASESYDPTRAPTPSQGTQPLRSVRPGGTPDSVLEGNGAAVEQTLAKASDDAPEISVGAAEVDWSPELGAASDLDTNDDAEDAGTAAEDAEIDDIAASQPPGPPASINRGPPSLPDSQVVVPATRPLKAHSSAELRLPSIIVNVEHDIEGLVTRLLAGDDKVLDRLAALGASAASYLVARFPGPIREADRFATGERASQRGPILRALVRIGQPAAPFLAVRSNDRDSSVRTWATQLLGEIPSVDAALAVSRRVADSSAEVRRAALEAGRLLQSDDDARVTLRDKVLSLAESTSSVESRVAAIEAIAHFRDGRATPRLMHLLDSRDEVGQSAEWALGVLTRQGFGRDSAAWETWWRERGGAHRIEWLIDSLMHDDAEIRRAAGEELKSLTKEYFGYYDDLPKAERAKAQKRYTDWWETTGKAKFPR